MRVVLEGALPGRQPVFFEDARLMIDWLRSNLGNVMLMSLDHDLPVRKDDRGTTIDCGTGRDVADYLATMPPTCPIVVHSSNTAGATGMMHALRSAGWPCVRVPPEAEIAWVARYWADQIKGLEERGWLK